MHARIVLWTGPTKDKLETPQRYQLPCRVSRGACYVVNNFLVRPCFRLVEVGISGSTSLKKNSITMTSLLKLGIQGIRSFNPEKPEVIEFEKPVTLIVGSNGAGKTSVIESLKMVTSGQLPPNCDKGHGFIHDPNLAGVPEVKGQIRLLLTNSSGIQVCVTRSLQLTHQKTRGLVKPTFRALEGVINTKNPATREESSVTKKCADMDVLVPSLMGVSRAILENVIFCHQEESCWPLTEKLQLKKKFDDIFGSSRYTKALEIIDKSKKDLVKETKEKLNVFKLLEKDLEQAKTMRSDLQKLETIRIERAAEYESMEVQVVETQQKLVEAEMTDKLVQDRKFLLAQKSETLSNLNLEISTIESGISEFFGEPLEFLAMQQKVINDRVSDSQSAIQTRKSDNSRILEQLRSAAERVRKLRAEGGAGELLSLKMSEIERCLVNLKDSLGNISCRLVAEGDLEGLKAINILREEISRSDPVCVSAVLDRLVEFFASAISFLRLEKQNSDDLAHAEFSEIETRKSQLAVEAERARGELRLGDGRKMEWPNFPFESSAGARAALVGLDGGIADLKTRSNDCDLEISSVRAEIKKLQEIRISVAAAQGGRTETLEAERLDLTKILERHSFQGPWNSENLQIRNVEISNNLSRISTEKQTLIQEIWKFLRAFNSQDRAKLETAQSELAMATAAERLYLGLKTKSLERQKCQLCRKSFNSPDCLHALAASVDEISKSVPKLLEVLRAKVEAAKAEGLQSREWVDISGFEVEFERLEGKMRELFEEQTRLITIAPIIGQLDRVEAEIKRRREISRSDGTELEEALRGLEGREVELSTKKSELQRELNAATSHRAQLVATIDALGIFESKKVAFDEETEAILVRRKAAELKLQEIAQQVASLDSAAANRRSARATSTALSLSKITTAESEFREISRFRDTLDELLRAERSLRARLGSQDLREALEAQEIEAEFTKKFDDSHAALLKLETEFAELVRVKSVLVANVALKEKERLIANITQEISDLQLEISTFNHDDTLLIRNCIASLLERRGRLQGELGQLNAQISSLSGRLNSPPFRDIDGNIAKSWIAHETAAVAAEDLDRYHSALDKALMKFHVMKMTEINSTIAQLWREVYKGNDIDCVAIRSDVEDEGDGKKSYNYRVVMVNSGVELEMRGRCSAGQRMLASILIRMALADSFAHNCGTLSLDEPTTNLDRANIEALATAIGRLIHARRNTPGFQLIVITHDEEFVRMISKHRFCDTYYRVTKDAQGYSMIKRHTIQEFH